MLLTNILLQRQRPHTRGQWLKLILGKVEGHITHTDLTAAGRPASRLLVG
ncbi:Uncharacterised protein [Yersinia enterocolitica]|nr:Uncharacterised protein [Yersinia enterocolitica]